MTEYVLVPVEPTEAMHAAANREWDGRASARSAGVWQAMIAAAPTPPSAPASDFHRAWGYAKDHPAECTDGYDKAAFKHVQFWLNRTWLATDPTPPPGEGQP